MSAAVLLVGTYHSLTHPLQHLDHLEQLLAPARTAEIIRDVQDLRIRTLLLPSVRLTSQRSPAIRNSR
jgi:hypothetical protein